MNSLFWALYLIDVIGGVPKALAAAVLTASIFAFIGAVKAESEHVTHETSRTDDNRIRWRGAFRWARPTFIVVLLVFLLLPSKNTMYMMLAIKTTDNIVQSATGQKLMNVLNKQVDAYIDEIGGDDLLGKKKEK